MKRTANTYVQGEMYLHKKILKVLFKLTEQAAD